jgi:hypothetical protein
MVLVVTAKIKVPKMMAFNEKKPLENKICDGLD